MALSPDRTAAGPVGQRSPYLLLLLLPGWAAFVVYLPALGNGFVWDDTSFLIDLPYLRDPDLWWRYVFEPLFVSQNYFRPIPLLTFVVEARIGNLDPFVFHLTNILLHVVNTTLVVVLARGLYARTDERRIPAWAGMAAGMFFALHPALTESVCWISDRFDLMMVMFLLLALLADARIRRPMRRAVAVGLLFLLAALCKETTVIFVAVLPLWHLALAIGPDFSLPRIRAALAAQGLSTVYAAVFVAGLSYLAFRFAALGMLYQSDSQMIAGSALSHALLVAKTLGWYGLLAFWPFGQLNPVHPGATPIEVTDLWAWVSAGGLAVAGGGIVLLARKSPMAGLLALASLVALAPVANIIPLTIGDNVVHDRYLIFPVALLSLALAAWLSADRARAPGVARPVAAAVLAVWAAFASVAIAAMVPHWEDNLTLWKRAYDKEPASRIAQTNYMVALVSAGKNDKSLELAQLVLRSHPQDISALHVSSLALLQLGRYEEAKSFSMLTLRHLSPGDTVGRLAASESLNLLGYLHLKLGEWDAAEKALLEAVRLTPMLNRPHFNLAILYYELGRDDIARRELDLALKFDPPELVEVHKRLTARKKEEVELRRRSPASGAAQHLRHGSGPLAR